MWAATARSLVSACRVSTLMKGATSSVMVKRAASLVGQHRTLFSTTRECGWNDEDWTKLRAYGDKPVTMLTLLKVKDHEALGRYVEALVPFMGPDSDVGLSFEWVGNPMGLVPVGPSEYAEFDLAAIIRYPTATKLFQMVDSDTYRAAYIHRYAGISRAITIPCADPGDADGTTYRLEQEQQEYDNDDANTYNRRHLDDLEDDVDEVVHIATMHTTATDANSRVEDGTLTASDRSDGPPYTHGAADQEREDASHTHHVAV